MEPKRTLSYELIGKVENTECIRQSSLLFQKKRGEKEIYVLRQTFILPK